MTKLALVIPEEAVFDALFGLYGVMEEIRKVERRLSLVPKPEYPLIDLDRKPTLPIGCAIVRDDEYGGGLLIWNKYTEGKKEFLPVSEGLAAHFHKYSVPYGIRIRDFLVRNPDQVPERWLGKIIVFKGTVLELSNGEAYPSLDCFTSSVFSSHSNLQVSTCLGIGKVLSEECCVA